MRMVDEKYYNLSCFVVFICFFFHLHMLFTFSALISDIYWCGIVLHQQILVVRHAPPAKIIGAAKAAPAAPVSTPMISNPLDGLQVCKFGRSIN